jgi:membrane protease YdiL (CAAX protease family)
MFSTNLNIKGSVFTVLAFGGLLFILKLLFLFVDMVSLRHFLSQFIVLCIILCIVLYRRNDTDETRLRIKKIEWKTVSLMFVIGCVSCLLVLYDPFMLFLKDIVDPTVMSDLGSTPDIWEFVASVILAPISEEIIFRGFILESLLKSYSPKKSILISAMLFAVPHAGNMSTVFLGGLILGWVYYKSENIIYCIITHATVNLVAFFINYVVYHSMLMEIFTTWESLNLFYHICIIIFLILILLLTYCIINKKYKNKYI